MPPNMTNAPTSLSAYRTTCGATLEEWARKLGVHKTTILRWETGTVPASRVREIEKALGIPRHVIRPDLYFSD